MDPYENSMDRKERDAVQRFDPYSRLPYGSNTIKSEHHPAQSLQGNCHKTACSNYYDDYQEDYSSRGERKRSLARNDTGPNENFASKYYGYGAKHIPPDTPRGWSRLPNDKYPPKVHSSPPSQESNSGGGTTVEVSPGEFLRLRGSDETWKAFLNDFYMPCVCVSCETMIFCIQDACCVVCPNCREISPLEEIGPDGGVGLGFTMETLAKWQNEIHRLNPRDHSFDR